MFVIITRSVSSVTQIKLIIGTFLWFFTGYIPFTLLSYNIIDETFLRLEVITHDFWLVRSLAIFKDRSTFFHANRIGNTTGIHRTAIHVHCNHSRGQFNFLIVHLTVTIQMGISALSEYDRVICFINNRRIQRLLLFRCNRINRQRIYQSTIYFQGIIAGCRIPLSALSPRT